MSSTSPKRKRVTQATVNTPTEDRSYESGARMPKRPGTVDGKFVLDVVTTQVRTESEMNSITHHIFEKPLK